jgi:hypothetical protein
MTNPSSYAHAWKQLVGEDSIGWNFGPTNLAEDAINIESG